MSDKANIVNNIWLIKQKVTEWITANNFFGKRNTLVSEGCQVIIVMPVFITCLYIYQINVCTCYTDISNTTPNFCSCDLSLIFSPPVHLSMSRDYYSICTFTFIIHFPVSLPTYHFPSEFKDLSTLWFKIFLVQSSPSQADFPHH